MDQAVIILTCFNRKEKTTECIRTLKEGNKNIDFVWVVVDDQSSDGTPQAIKELIPEVHLIPGTGSLFWNGGMNRGMEYAKEHVKDAKYYVLVNDDVVFDAGILDAMAAHLGDKEEVLVGATYSDEHTLSYGGIKYAGKKNLHYRFVGPEEKDLNCDTFNANCVMIPRKIFLEAGATDPHYSHSLGDFDYGFRIRRMGYPIHVFERFCGHCNDNPTDGTWQDKKLPICTRLKLKKGPKGLPAKDWYRYLRKNFGLDVAIVRSVTPYIKILLGR